MSANGKCIVVNSVCVKGNKQGMYNRKQTGKCMCENNEDIIRV